MVEDNGQLQAQIAVLNSKFDTLQTSIQDIKEILARWEGKELPNRVFVLENKMNDMQKYQAERAWIPEEINTHSNDIKALNRMVYKVMGGLVVSQVIITVLGKFFLDMIIK